MRYNAKQACNSGYMQRVEIDAKHPETLRKYDVPGRTVTSNAAARPGANVIRVRFSEWSPKWWQVWKR